MAEGRIVKIVFEGGPASGKTAVMDYLKENLAGADGWDVVFVPEVAQSFFMNEPEAIKYAVKNNTFIRQYFINRTELFSEKLVIENARRKGGNCLIVFDRGVSDAMVYLPKDEADMICSEEEQREYESHYDMVCFFLGDIENYLGDERTVRVEEDYSAVEALGRKAYEVWHRCRNVVDFPQRRNLSDKCREVADAINGFLGEIIFN